LSMSVFIQVSELLQSKSDLVYPVECFRFNSAGVEQSYLKTAIF
jgi:hypothetical protein